MNKQQRVHLMADLWPAACEYQQWNRNDKQKRYDVFARVLGHIPRHASTLARGGHISANDFDELEYGLVKKELMQLAGRVPLQDPRKEQLLWVITNRIMRCVRLYRNDETFLATIAKGKFKTIKGLSTIADLSIEKRPGQKASDLHQLLFTMSARLNELRNEAGETEHEMCYRARVKCRCKDCTLRRAGQPTPPPEEIQEPDNLEAVYAGGPADESDPY